MMEPNGTLEDYFRTEIFKPELIKSDRCMLIFVGSLVKFKFYCFIIEK